MLSIFLPLLLVTLLVVDIFLLSTTQSATQSASSSQRAVPSTPYIIDLGSHAVWCGPSPPALQLDWGSAASTSLAGEGPTGILPL